MSKARASFDDLPNTVGRKVVGEAFVLTRDESEMFHKATWLDRAYPTDVEEFPESLVEGFWLLGLLDATARFASGLDHDDTWGLNYGLDSVRFVSPVHFGDRVIPTFETLRVVPKDEGYKVLRHCTFTVEGAPRPAMVADWWSLVLPRGVHKALRT